MSAMKRIYIVGIIGHRDTSLMASRVSAQNPQCDVVVVDSEDKVREGFEFYKVGTSTGVLQAAHEMHPLGNPPTGQERRRERRKQERRNK